MFYLICRCKASDTEGQENPATGQTHLGGVVVELFADHAVDLIPELYKNDISNNIIMMMMMTLAT